jgi:thiosulfate/3-mercaptopyruvate sulfurtransferase
LTNERGFPKQLSQFESQEVSFLFKTEHWGEFAHHHVLPSGFGTSIRACDVVQRASDRRDRSFTVGREGANTDMVDKSYGNPDLLWSPAELAARLSDPNLRIIDVRPVHTLIQEGWIPGAAHFDLFGLSLNNTAPEPLQAFMWAIEHVLEFRGVNLDTPVVFYEDIAGMRAARGFWFLEYLGHNDVHVLDGGFNAWKGAGLPISHEMPAPKVTTFRTRPRPELHWSADELATHLRDPSWPSLTRARMMNTPG